MLDYFLGSERIKSLLEGLILLEQVKLEFEFHLSYLNCSLLVVNWFRLLFIFSLFFGFLRWWGVNLILDHVVFLFFESKNNLLSELILVLNFFSNERVSISNQFFILKNSCIYFGLTDIKGFGVSVFNKLKQLIQTNNNFHGKGISVFIIDDDWS